MKRMDESVLSGTSVPEEVNVMMRSKRMKQRILQRLGLDEICDLARTKKQFENDEDGGMTIIALFVFILMLTMGGISIDLMRHEMERTTLQATLDSAVLAGAGAPAGATEAEIKAIVEDFFLKSGKAAYLDELSEDDIVATLNARRVPATASMTINTYLMKLMGVNTLGAAGSATAEVRTPKLEVALVLDVSGSMSGSKLTNLKTAAKEFVTTILNSADPGDTVISVVPFSWTVAPGEAIYAAMQDNINDTHDWSSCLRFTPDQYYDSYISPALDPLEGPAYSQQIYTSRYGGFDNLSSDWRSCFNDDYAEVLPFSISESELHTKIDAMVASGNTSGHIGMKWGAALLDPAFQSVATALQAPDVGVVDSTLSNVPSLYTEPDTMKIIVMMGDGANTTSYYFDESSPYRGPNSDLYELTFQEMEFDYARHKYKNKTSYSESKCSSSKWICYYTPTGDEEYRFYLRDGSSYYSVEENDWLSSSEFSALESLPEYVDTRRLDWEEAWGHMSPDWYESITNDDGPWDDYNYSEKETGSTKNTYMSRICSATKDQGVTVYTIGFEVPQNGTAETELRACASSLPNYYRASGVNISDAFGSIASNVQNLRLTQ